MKSLIPQAFLCTPLQGKLVSQHGYKLPIGRLILRRAHPAPERLIQGIYTSAVPRHFNRMADGALDFAGAQGGAARLLGGCVYCISTLMFIGVMFPISIVAYVYIAFGLQNASGDHFLVKLVKAID